MVGKGVRFHFGAVLCPPESHGPKRELEKESGFVAGRFCVRLLGPATGPQ